jgi:hypothetical protein
MSLTDDADDVLDRRLGDLQRHLLDERHETWAGIIMSARTRLKMFREEARLFRNARPSCAPFIAPSCGAAFNSYADMVTHERTHHPVDD